MWVREKPQASPSAKQWFRQVTPGKYKSIEPLWEGKTAEGGPGIDCAEVKSNSDKFKRKKFKGTLYGKNPSSHCV